jgi:hypothetical protein
MNASNTTVRHNPHVHDLRNLFQRIAPRTATQRHCHNTGQVASALAMAIESRLLDTKIPRRLLDDLVQCRAEPYPFGVRHFRVRRLATPHQDDPVEKLRCAQNGLKVLLGIEGGDVGIEACFHKRLVPLARVAQAKHAENGVLVELRLCEGSRRIRRVARPAIGLGRLRDLGDHRIEVDIATQVGEVMVGIHEDRLEPPPKEGPIRLLHAVISLGVETLEMTHGHTQVGAWGMHQ